MDASQIITTIVSILSVIGVGTILPMLVADRLEKKKQQSTEAKEKLRLERQTQIREVVRDEISPLKDDVKNLKKDIESLQKTDVLQRQGLQATLRDRLYELYEECSQKHFTTMSQRDNFENMYQKYHALYANGVMDDIHDRFFSLPSEEEYFGH